MNTADCIDSSQRLPSRKEFLARLNSFRSQSIRLAFKVLGGDVILLVGAMLMMCHLGPTGSHWSAAMAIIFLIAVPVWTIHSFWRAEKTVPRCVHCEVPYGRSMNTVVVTGCCPRCSEFQFFVPPVADVPAQSETTDSNLVSMALTDEEAQRLLKELKQIVLRWLLGGAITSAVGLLLGLLVIQLFDMGKEWTQILLPYFVSPGVAIAFWSAIRMERRYHKTIPSCPHCGAKLLGMARRTGYCDECGFRAVEDPQPGLTPWPENWKNIRWSIADFARKAPRRSRQCFAFLISCFASMFVLLMIGTRLALFPDDDPNLLSYREMLRLFSTGLLTIGLPLGILAIGTDRLTRDFRCPTCRKSLLEVNHTVISSRRCYHCGTEVLAEVLPVPLDRAGEGVKGTSGTA